MTSEERLDRERKTIAKAEAEINAGFGIEWEDTEKWLDALEHDPDAPLPASKRV